MKNKIYSRIGEDIWVLDKCGNKTDGYFIDIGAGGIQDSNTYLLELLGWDGLAVEPQEVHRAFLESRKCKKEYMPIFDEKKALFAFAEREGRIGMSGIKECMMISAHRLISREVMLDCITFDELAAKHNVPLKIDYINLDVEGAELRILKMIDFNKYDITTLTVEHNKTGNYRSIRDYLLYRGYSADDTGYDFWFCKEDKNNG